VDAHGAEPDGGWGETIATYDKPALRGTGPSTASQTAWALLALLAAGDDRSECLASGVKYLLDTQKQDGSWFEVPYTGTGFPRVFYLKYTLYYQYFPLMALTRYARTIGAGA
jgi:squalene-hopene/tetraprenyl-beta-curcumene cyclase